MKKEKAYETMIVLAVVVLIFSLIYRKTELVYVSLGLLLIPIFFIRLAFFISKIWLTFSEYLGFIMNTIILFLCFYLFLVPLSYLQKLFGKNQVLRKPSGDSYFQKRNHVFTRKDLEKPW